MRNKLAQSEMWSDTTKGCRSYRPSVCLGSHSPSSFNGKAVAIDLLALA